MTLNDAIERVDALKPNNYSDDEKVQWLSDLDLMIHKEVILTHKHDEESESFEGYTMEDLNKPLIVTAPYDKLYISYLSSKIDYFNCEYGKYNNSVTMFRADYSEFCSYYNRNVMPIGDRLRYF